MLSRGCSRILLGALGLLVACRSPAPPEVAEPEPPPAKVEPKAEPNEKPPEEQVRGEFAESRKFEGNDTEALYKFEGDTFTTDLEMRAKFGDPQDPSGIFLRHPGSKTEIIANGPRCVAPEQGDSLTAQIFDHGPVPDGARRLLEIWISCRMGEDIVSVDSAVWLVLDDGDRLWLFWQGGADYHGSWVCATYDGLEFALEGEEVVLTRKKIGEIYEPGEQGYDCEDAREFVETRGTERIPLPELQKG